MAKKGSTRLDLRVGTCLCAKCNEVVKDGETGKRYQLKYRGNKYGYLCDAHTTSRGDYSYDTENDIHRGTHYDNTRGYTYSTEFEVANPTEQLRAELLAFDFIPTSDCTTGTEFKSPIWDSLKPIAKKMHTIQSIMHDSDCELIGDGDGTHFHVGNIKYINTQNIARLRTWYHSLFLPLSDFLTENSDITIKLFGRDFTYYACSINEYTDATDHCNFINLQHNYTIEYRLCKYVDDKQYLKLIHLVKKYTMCICDNFLAKYDTMTIEQRRHKAKVVAKQLVRLTQRAYDEIMQEENDLDCE